MAVEPDDVPRLFAAEDCPLAQRLHHIAVADVGRDDTDAVLVHQPMETEVRHRRDGDDRYASMQREDRDDLVAVDLVPLVVDGEHPVTVAVERDPEIEAAVDDGPLQRAQVGRAAADVDVEAVRLVADCRHLRAELLERPRCTPRVRAVRAVDADAQRRKV